jgi:hypothetical protein
VLDHSVPIDVWLVRLRIDVVTDVHTAMLSPAAARANWVETHTLATVRITPAVTGRSEQRELRSGVLRGSADGPRCARASQGCRAFHAVRSMAYHTTGTSGFIQYRVPSYLSPTFSMTRRAAICAAAVTLMMRPSLCCSKPRRSAASAPSGGQATSPPHGVQLEPHLDLVDIRPVLEFIETDSANPTAGGLLDGCPWAESVNTPLPHGMLSEAGDSVGREVPSAPDGRVGQKTLKLRAILFKPGSQDEALSLNGDHGSGAAERSG